MVPGRMPGLPACRLGVHHREVIAMKIRYFTVDSQGQLQKASQMAVRELWEGNRGADELGCPAGNELRLVSVVCDDDLVPDKIYLLRLPLIDGAFTSESRLTLKMFTRPDCVTPRELTLHHTEGWPGDFFKQLAVALDVPVACLHVPLGIGGPLFLAAAFGVTLRQALRHLR
jgi:hypothetical protein